jgi:ParB family chromosome partitioning protein
LKSSAKNIKLTSVDELFSTEQERQEAQDERVVRLPLTELHYFKGYPAMQSEIPFTGQPFRVRDDDPKMLETLESVKQRGVRTPGLARPDPEGGYEIISGHRRHRASELAGLPDMPFIVREMSDEEAVIELVDANIQRDDILPSEKAWAYRMKKEAIKCQGARTDLTSPQVAAKFRSDDEIAKSMGISGDTLQRYTRFTELIPELLSMVDEKKIALTPAYELSFLKKEEQTLLLDAMDSEQASPSLSQAQRLKKFSQEDTLSIDVMRAIMSEEKKSELDRITLTGDKLRKYFPKSYTPQQMEDTILKLLEGWYKKRQQSLER